MLEKGGDDVIKIGDFAKICNVSARTLRYYDQEGVLKADFVDETSGYRFYSLEAVEKYKKLVFYKELGFSLREIKKLLAATEEEEKEMLKKKKGTLLSSVQQIQGQVQTINGMFAGDEEGKALSNILNLPFSDDPEVVGKWKLCGMLSDENDITTATAVPPEMHMFKEIIFMPGGAPVWAYFWTKGIFYTMTGKNNSAVPHPYHTFRQDGEHYMIIQFGSADGIDLGYKPLLILYRQLDTTAYSEDQTRPHIDKVDYPFIEDPKVRGAWSVVDFVRHAEDFDPAHLNTQKKYLWMTDLQFLPRGICLKFSRSETSGKKVSWGVNYTKGLVINRSKMTAEEYIIKTFNGKDFLLVQHKSGDYYYGGIEPYWYVFERKDDFE